MPPARRLGDFSVLDIVESTGTEGLAAAAVVFAVAGNTAQRSWTYERLLPLAGSHVLVAGCASYHAAVDHHLGALAASLGRRVRGRGALPRRGQPCTSDSGPPVGHGCPSRPSPTCQPPHSTRPSNEFRFVNGLWHLGFQGAHAQLPDAKGLRDLATLIGSPGQRRPRLHPARRGAVPRRC